MYKRVSRVWLSLWLQVYLEVSCERALGGGPQRPSKMGPAIAAAVVACVRTYLQHCTKAWDEVRVGGRERGVVATRWRQFTSIAPLGLPLASIWRCYRLPMYAMRLHHSK